MDRQKKINPDKAVRGTFFKSSYSGDGGCVEVALLTDGNVKLRDSKDITQPAFTFNQREWTAFLKGVKDGEFDA
jgi:hypothetical protein